MRVGVHSGRVLSGLFGVKRARYALLGSTVAKTQRMESSGEPGETHISAATHALVADHRDFEFFCRGGARSKPLAPSGGAAAGGAGGAGDGAGSGASTPDALAEPTYFVRSGWQPGRPSAAESGAARGRPLDAAARGRRSSLAPAESAPMGSLGARPRTPLWRASLAMLAAHADGGGALPAPPRPLDELFWERI